MDYNRSPIKVLEYYVTDYCHAENVREYDYDEVKDRIQHLIDVSYSYDDMQIVGAMKDLVPEFISKNSCFEALDKKN